MLAVLAVIAGLSLFTVSETRVAITHRVRRHHRQSLRTGAARQVALGHGVPSSIAASSPQSYNGETFLTNDNRGLIVDFYIKWRVKDPVQFYNATGGSRELAG